MLFEKLKTVTHEPSVDVLTSRLLQSVIIASVSLPVGEINEEIKWTQGMEGREREVGRRLG